MKNFGKNLIKSVIFFVCMAFLVGCLVFVVSLPKGDRWRENTLNSYYEMEEEGLYPHLLDGLNYAYWDNYTSAIFVNVLLHIDNEHPVVSMTEWFHENGKLNKDDAVDFNTLCGSYLKGEETVWVNYSRYWMGNFIFLIPLLYISSFSGIRTLMLLTGLAMFAYISINLWKFYGWKLTAAFTATCLAGSWYYNIMCITLGIDIMLCLVASSALCFIKKKNSRWLRDNYGLLFALMGGWTMFFCMLSQPLITLGIPLTLYIVFVAEDEAYSGMETFFTLLKASISWVFGYSFTMLAKSFLTRIVGDQPTATSRMIELFGDGTIIMRIVTSMKLFAQLLLSYKIITISVIMLFCLAIIFHSFSPEKVVHKNYWVVLLIGMMPFLWEFIFYAHTNHGPDRCIYCISIFSLLITELNSIDFAKILTSKENAAKRQILFERRFFVFILALLFLIILFAVRFNRDIQTGLINVVEGLMGRDVNRGIWYERMSGSWLFVQTDFVFFICIAFYAWYLYDKKMVTEACGKRHK